MITLEHGPNGSINIAGLDYAVIRRLTDKQLSYWCGDEPPNYPMPALVTIQIDGTYCSYASWYSNDDCFWSDFITSRAI